MTDATLDWQTQRFARVLRYRDDKRPDEADTIDTVRTFYGE
jgi:ATP-dependent DNA ligase